MNGTNKSTAIEALSENVLNTQFEDLEQVVVGNAKNRIIDIVGCAIGGVDAPGNEALIDLVRNWGGSGEATILVHGIKAPAHNVAMVNSIMARSYDFEVINALVEGKPVGSHISGTTVTTAIAMGEATGKSGKEIITALIVGDDVASRMQAAASLDLNLGWDAIGTLSIFGAIAVAGRLLGLNKLQMRNAFGFALTQAAGTMQCIWDGATSFKLPQGLAARNGIFAAELAKAGWIGVKDALLSKCGYYHLYTRGCDHPEVLTRDLGKKYYAETYFKPYPCGLPTHGPIKCALVLVQKHDIEADDIAEVIIYVPRRPDALDDYYAKPFEIRDFPHCDANFSYQYAVSTALLRKSVRLENFTEKSILAPQVNDLIKKTRLAELPGAAMPSGEVKVRMKDGREFSELYDISKDNPLTKLLSKRDEIITKFLAQVEFSKTVTRKNAEKALGQLEKLEEMNNINGAVELVVTADLS